MGTRPGRRRLAAWLEVPAAAGLDVDHPHTTLARREVLRSKPFLRRVYGEWYGLIRESLPASDGRVLELGAGAGFLRELIPGLLSSEIVAWEGASLVADGSALPLCPGSLRGIVMTNVFHHLPDARAFLREAGRAVRPGGVVAMIEPWVTAWSRVVYRYVHPEPFEPAAKDWDFPSSGPLSGANGALPWIVFARDQRRFEEEFPEWAIERVEPLMPVRYLLAGGLGYRSLMPGFTFPLWRLAERAAGPMLGRLAMFALIVLRRRDSPGSHHSADSQA